MKPRSALYTNIVNSLNYEFDKWQDYYDGCIYGIAFDNIIIKPHAWFRSYVITTFNDGSLYPELLNKQEVDDIVEVAKRKCGERIKAHKFSGLKRWMK